MIMDSAVKRLGELIYSDMTGTEKIEEFAHFQGWAALVYVQVLL